jgi:flagellar protein FliO/FliZ
MDAFSALRALSALILVLGLILGLSWLLRRFGGGLGRITGTPPSDLRVVEWKSLDARRRLAVVQWDGREHLLCLGPGGDCRIAERSLPAPVRPSSPAATSQGEEP